MADNDGKRSFQLRNSEIEARAIEALEQARMLPPGARRHELLKEAGKLRMRVTAERLTTEASGSAAKGNRWSAKGRGDKT